MAAPQAIVGLDDTWAGAVDAGTIHRVVAAEMTRPTPQEDGIVTWQDRAKAAEAEIDQLKRELENVRQRATHMRERAERAESSLSAAPADEITCATCHKPIHKCAGYWVHSPQAPTAWLHTEHPGAYVITERVKDIWRKVDPEHVEHYSIPLYTKP